MADVKQWRVLSGSWLKVLAMLTMVIDHSTIALLRYDSGFAMPLFAIGGKGISGYYLMRCIGRLAFPLFAFLLVEGFMHTHNRWKYGRNLLLFALISEIPFDLMWHGSIFASGQNVFFTLFLGFMALCVIERMENKEQRSERYDYLLPVSLFALIAAGILIHSDYGNSGVSFIILLYALRKHPILQAAAGCCMLPMRWIAGLAFIPINLYNGKRGFIQGPIAKYSFYVFYPLHMIIIYLFSLIL